MFSLRACALAFLAALAHAALRSDSVLSARDPNTISNDGVVIISGDMVGQSSSTTTTSHTVNGVTSSSTTSTGGGAPIAAPPAPAGTLALGDTCEFKPGTNACGAGLKCGALGKCKAA